MAQVSSWSQVLLKQLQVSSLSLVKSQYFHDLFRSQLRWLSRWLIGLWALGIMLVWNWKLVLATGTGMGVMLGVYPLLGFNWQAQWSSWYRFLNSSNRQLTIAVGSGGLAILITYTVTSIWASAANRWLATGAILQGLGTLLTLVLLIWQIISQGAVGQEIELEKLCDGLTQANSLSRLMSVRKLTHLMCKGRLNRVHQLQVSEYLRLMLAQEEEQVIREAILDALQVCSESTSVELCIQMRS